ncbi:hypothetical protein ACFP56_12665 [Paenibacillus septentrionalis]|uniref:Uncharacterized protein n=1 Tax=Paenibacillus septentrionalis TaxID=429342 RepID=A0ABW1V7N3_9BACL
MDNFEHYTWKHIPAALSEFHIFKTTPLSNITTQTFLHYYGDFPNSYCAFFYADNKIFLKGCFHQLKSPVGVTVLREIFLNEKREKDVAEELKIYQHAVNKWKKKIIQEVYQMNNF